LDFVEHVIEFSYSNQVIMCPVGYPLVAPGENGDISIEDGFGSWSFALYNLFGPGPGVCPDDKGDHAPPQYF